MQEIKSDRLYHAFMTGAREVMASRRLLNDINVFPVPDGDTGNNLNNMMHSILMHSEAKPSIKETLDSISNSAILGARGNSGAIFSQYIHGISLVEAPTESFTAEYFIAAAKRGYTCAYAAVEIPVEGTILTTMRVFHEALHTYNQSKNSLNEVLDSAYLKVEESVLETTQQLKKLKEAAVVDSGAKGFALFVKGFIDGLKGTTLHKNDLKGLSDEFLTLEPSQHNHLDIDVPTHYRYCSEFLIENKQEGGSHDHQGLKNDLSAYGDSLVISRGKLLSKIHLHTDRPDQVVHRISRDYKLLEQKIEDMKRQYELRHNRLYKTVILTDSSADIPKSFLDKGQVVVLPLELIMDGSSYRDKITIDNDYLFDWVEKTGGHPTSSQPNLAEVEQVIKNLMYYYDEMVVITVSGALSGTYNIIKKAAKSYGDKIHLIDSKQNSVAQGLLVMRAIELLEAGKKAKEICHVISEEKARTKILVSVADLNSMIASGRLNVKVGRIANILGLYPLVTLNQEGRGGIEKIFWGSKNKLKKLLMYIEGSNQKKPIDTFAVSYVNNEEKALAFASDLEVLLGIKCSYVVACSSVIAAGAGKDALAVAYMRK